MQTVVVTRYAGVRGEPRCAGWFPALPHYPSACPRASYGKTTPAGLRQKKSPAPAWGGRTGQVRTLRALPWGGAFARFPGGGLALGSGSRSLRGGGQSIAGSGESGQGHQ